MPFQSKDIYHVRRPPSCKYCSTSVKHNIVNGRNKGYQRTCGNEKCLSMRYSPENNKKRAHIGKNHPKWIENRQELKQKRMYTEEKWFMKELIKERGYKCELTGKEGILSVHHIKPVWKYPELIFSKESCIVITKAIHMLFHKEYGFKSDECDWASFIKNNEYQNI